MATVTGVVPSTDSTLFDLVIPLACVHPASGESGDTDLLVGIALAPSTEAARAEIVLSVQGFVSRSLEEDGHRVPPERVAVALL